jgi:energy-coupling factor transport system substrate-specific component
VSQTWVRAGGGVVAFAIVVIIGMVGVFSFAPDQATNSWALMSAIALVAGFAVYAAIEYTQTNRLDSITRQFDTRTIVLMPLAIALNIILGQAVAAAIKIPIYLDSIGTILVGALAGPLAGALTGFLSNALWTYVVPPPFQSAFAAPFAIVAVVIGLLAGVFGRAGWLRPRPETTDQRLVIGAVVSIGLIIVLAILAVLGYQAIIGGTGIAPQSDELVFVVLGWLALVLVVGTVIGLLVLLFQRRDLTAAYVVVAGVITGIIAALISAPISANVFGGVTGSGTDFLVAALRQGGADIAAATLGQGLISDPIDKVTTFFVVYLILGAMAVRAKARFPQGERLIADESEPAVSGAPMGAAR